MIQDTLKKPKRKNYSDEFKEFLVQEAISSGRSIASIARDNGINQNLLHNWKRQNRAKIIQAPENTLPAITHEPSTPSNFIPIKLDSQQSFNSASLAISTIQSVQPKYPHDIPHRLDLASNKSTPVVLLNYCGAYNDTNHPNLAIDYSHGHAKWQQQTHCPHHQTPPRHKAALCLPVLQ